jgi:hypothetical protein
MSKSNHTEAQMIGALKQLKAGRKAEDVAREVTCRSIRSTSGGEVRGHGCEPGAGSEQLG